jgi:alpha-galactosidase
LDLEKLQVLFERCCRLHLFVELNEKKESTMEKTTITLGSPERATIFCRSGEQLYLQQLGGLACGINGRAEGPQSTRGLAVVEGDDFLLADTDWHCADFSRQGDALHVSWTLGATGLVWSSDWQWHETEGMLTRRDRLINQGSLPRRLHRLALRFGLSPDRYDLWVQTGSWSHENQLRRMEFAGGRWGLASQGGRTLQGGAPYLFVAQNETNFSLAFHGLPRGDWELAVDQSRHAGDVSRPFTVIEFGPKSAGFDLPLAPQAEFCLPEVWVQQAEGARPADAAPALQRFALGTLLNEARPGFKTAPPLVYNTWFDAFECLEPARLRRQLTAARAAGCEVFVVDAGWFGACQGSWHEQVGDWREKPEAAFAGNMAAFAAEVRAAGLGFGLWMEPERASAFAPAVVAHPDWFRPGDGGFFYPDLTRADAYAYIRSEMVRLIETYSLVWMKVDFNFELGTAPDAFAGYTARWQTLLAELHELYPALFIEGCASGGMRSDLCTLAAFDAHFLSDTVNPFDSLRLTQGAALRLPPGRLTKWAVLRAAGSGVVRYGQSADHSPQRLLTPACADWENCFEADLDFCWLATLPGIPGLSGDLASLNAEQLARLAQFNAFYRQQRTSISSSVTTLLTPPRPQGDLSGWVAFELSAPGNADLLLLTYRLEDGRAQNCFRLPTARAGQRYVVSSLPEMDQMLGEVSGEALREEGWQVELAEKNRATAFWLRSL